MKRISLVLAFIVGVLVVLVPVIGRSQPFVSTPHLTLPHLVANNPASGEDEEDKETPEKLLAGTQALDGLFKLYRDSASGKVWMELRPDQLDVDYLMTMTLDSGLGEAGLHRGQAIDRFLFRWRRVNNRVQFVLPNHYFRTRPGDPLQRSVQQSFSDSVLNTLVIRAEHPQRKTLLVDATPLFLSDIPGLSAYLATVFDTSYTIDSNKSYVDRVQAFPFNIELASVYGFSGNFSTEAPPSITTLPDSRSFNLRVHYSLSQLPPKNSYQPRLADERIGYFLTAFQDLSNDTSSKSPFVRYINRWHLEKADPTAALSPPKQPITFWIENTVPLEYRQAVREGILMWNKAFEQAGFQDAIVAEQMPDHAPWDPADVRYNTIRWFNANSSGILGIGPSHVNPLTGEILDADILINASFARFARREYELHLEGGSDPANPQSAKSQSRCRYGLSAQYFKQQSKATKPRRSLGDQSFGNDDFCYGLEASQQFLIGANSLLLTQNVLPNGVEIQTYIQDFLRSLVAHEVGHTLGLRHNFRASAMLSPAELNNPAITREKGLVGSVMDYAAVNLAPTGTPQGDFYTRTVGPYDQWAIAYGYTPNDSLTPDSEKAFLAKIARRAPEPDLAYATDDDVFADLDPLIHVFDLSNDLLTYAPAQLDRAIGLWQKLDRRYPKDNESFNEVRILFSAIFNYYVQYSSFFTTYIGGQSFNRFRGGDTVGRLPFEPVTLDQQRHALKLIQAYVFDETRFQFSPELLNKLAPSRWNHWGQRPGIFLLDYPIYDQIRLFQGAILSDLLSYDRLARLRDAELKAKSDQVLSLPELFDTVQTGLWQNLSETSVLRRGLQRDYLTLLSNMVLRTADVPDEAQTIAAYQLRRLQDTVDITLRRSGRKLDTAVRAHLEDVRDRLAKVLNAPVPSR